MIQNERQYKITKAQVDNFGRKLQSLSTAPSPGIHPRIAQAQRDAIQSQLEELREEVAAYEELRAGRPKVLELTSLNELPAALIQARIASSLTQRELAERMGMKEQQIQRYEATAYSGASLSRIIDVVNALGLQVREEVFLEGSNVSLERLMSRAEAAGLSKSFVKQRLVQETGPGHGLGPEEGAALRTAALLNRIFGWTPPVLFGDGPLSRGGAALEGARFKLPPAAATRSTEVYATYAHYVAGLLVRATPSLIPTTIPSDAKELRDALLSSGRDISFESVLDYVWGLGVAVLPLSDPGAFHAATWRISGRNVIVLKNGSRLASRWVNDLLHELRHAAEAPDDETLSFIDYEALAKNDAASDDEVTASVFAGDVLLDGQADRLAKLCAERAGGSIEKLKSVVPRVARAEGVDVGALANYLAFRLVAQGQPSWWGAATNLQKGGIDPLPSARARALSHLNLTFLDDVERSALLRAIEGDPL